MNCPNCGAEDCYRDSADVGIGVMYGPYGCPCGWSEDPRFDITAGPKTESAYRVDQWGGLTPPATAPKPLCAKCGSTLTACQTCGKSAQCGESWCVECTPDGGFMTTGSQSSGSAS